MRALVLASGLGLVAGCLDPDVDLDLGNACFFPGPCVTTSRPFLFLEETPTDVALGGESNVAYLAHHTLTGFEVVSNDPKVVAVESRDGGVFVMRAVGAGSTLLAAHAADGATLERLSIRVARVASVAFAFAPAGNEPQPRLAALPGARELLRVLPRDSNDLVLGGADKLLDVSFTGDLTRIDPGSAQSRLGVFSLFDTPAKPGYDIGVQFGAVGGGSITASFDGVGLGSLPIEVIAAASDVVLEVSNPPVTNSVFVVDLVGSDANGVPVAGLVGDFTATPPGLVTIVSPISRGEVLVATHATPGTVTISAALPDRVVSTTITIR